MFLKGKQQQFIFDNEDLAVLYNKAFDYGFIFFRSISITEIDKLPVENIIELNNLLRNDMNIVQFFIVPFTKRHNVYWEKINLKDGRIRYDFLSTYSQGIQLLLPKENSKRISVGRISACTSWKDDETGEICHATYGIEVYALLKKIIKALSKGKLGVIQVGENAYAKAMAGDKVLAYDLHNPDTYDVESVKVKKGKEY